MISRRSGSLVNSLSNLLSGLKGPSQVGSRKTRRKRHANPQPANWLESLETRALLSALTVSSDVTSAGAIVLSATDSASTGDDLTVNAAVTIHSDSDTITLNAGDNLELIATSVIETTSGADINLNLDSGDADTGVGSTANLAGTLTAANVNVTGEADDDIINLSATAYSTTPVTIDGAGGTNQLNVDVTGVSDTTIFFTSATSGRITSSSHEEIAFSNISAVSATGGSFDSVGIDISLHSVGDNSVEDRTILNSDGSGGVEMRVNDVLIATVSEADYTSIVVFGSTDDDQLVVDHSSGVVTLPVFFAGGTGVESTSVIGTGSSSAVYTPSASASGNGTVAVDGAGLLTMSGAQAVDISQMATATLSLPGAADELTIVDGTDTDTGASAALRISGTTGGVTVEAASFFNNSVLAIDTTDVDGTDTINVTSATGSHGNAAISIDTGGTSADGDTLNLNGSVTTAGAQTYDNTAVALGGTVVLTSSSSGNVTFLDAPIDGAQSLTINTSGTTLLNSDVGGTTPLTSLTTDAGGTTTVNAATVATSGAQTFNDAVTLNTGTQTFTSSAGNVSFQSTLEGAVDLVVNAAAATSFGGVVGGTTPLNSITTDASGTTTLNANVTTSGAQAYNDAVTVGASLTASGSEVDVSNAISLGSSNLEIDADSDDNRLTGVISGSGNLTFTGDGTADLFLSAANTYSGTTHVSDGDLWVSSNTGLGSSAGGTTVTNTATLHIDGNLTMAETITLQGTVTVTSDSTASNSGNVAISGGSVVFDSGNAAASLTISGIVSGTDGLTKSGAGTLTLSGVNTYVGDTAVSVGTLRVNGSTVAGSAFNVASGATLGGNGSIAADVSIASGGTLAPGNSPGSLGSGDLDLPAGADFDVEIAGVDTPGTDYDQVDVTGTVTLGGNLNITDTSSTVATAGDTIVLISNDGSDAVSGTFDSLPAGTAVTINSQSWRILYDGGDGNDVVLEFDDAELSIDDVTLAESDSGTTDFTFTVTLDSPVGGSFTVSYATADTGTADSSDFTSKLGSLSFSGLTSGETKTVTISVAGDETVELDETFFVSLFNVTGGTHTSTPTIADGTGLATITNDDSATVSIDDVTLTEGDSGTTTFTFTATLNSAVDAGVTVSFATADGTAAAASDYTAQSGSVSFDGTNGETETIAVVVTAEELEELDETFTVVLSSPSASGRDVTIADSEGLGTILDDDRIAVNLSADLATGTEAGTTEVMLTATADSAVSGDQTFDLAVSGTNIGSSDFVLSNTTITIADGATTGTVTFTIQDDAVVELQETATITFSNPSSGVRVGTTDSVEVVIGDNDAASLSINDLSVTEGDSGTATLTFTVTLSGDVDEPFDVDFASADGTANAGSDYTAVSDTLTFDGTSGETETISIEISGDEVVELDQTLFVNLSNVQAGGRNVTVSDNQGEGTITNDDAATLSIDDVTLAEGDSGDTAFTFTITLSDDIDAAFIVGADTSDGTAQAGSDYTANTGTNIGFTGTAGEAKEFTVQVTGDEAVESAEGFLVTLSNLSAGGRNITFADAEGAGTINNDDIGVPVNLSVSSAAGTEADTTAITVTITADNAVIGDQTVDVAVNGTGITATDYDLSATTATILDGETTGTVTFTVSNDDLVEQTETAAITISNPSTGIALGTTTSQNVTITDDDTATLSINDVTLDEGDSGNAAFTFTVTLNNTIDTGITVDYDSASGTATSADGDFVSNTGNTLSFTGTAGETQTITIDVAGDTKVELDETFLVNLSNVISSGRSVTLADAQGTGTITNDDAATLSIDDVILDEGDSGTTNFTFTVTLDADIDVPLTVDYATADGTATSASDYTANAGTTLAFTGAASETQSFSIAVNGDAVAELDETFLVNLSAISANGRAVTLADAQGLGTITDEDGIHVNLTADLNAGTEADTTVVTLTATADTAVSGDQTVDITVTGTNVDASDFTLNNSTITIADGQTTGSVTFTVTDDDLTEALESVAVELTNPSVGISLGSSVSQTIALTDNDSAQLSISDAEIVEGDSGEQMLVFTVTLDSAVDTAFTVDYSSADGTATAGSDYTAVSGTLSFAGTIGETQTIEVPISGDEVVELDEGFVIDLSNVVSNGRTVSLADAQAAGTITNNDSATLSIDDIVVAEGDSGDTTFAFSVTLDNAVDSAVSVDFSTADGTATTAASDYTSASGTVNFAGTAGETQSVEVLVTGDTDEEVDETFLVNLANALAAGRSISIADASGEATIEDDDGIPVNFGISRSTGTEAATSVITLVAIAATPVSGDQTVDVVVTGTGVTSGDYTLGTATITIYDGQIVGVTTFTIQDDDTVESVETAVITLTNPSAGVSLPGTVAQSVQITSDDAATLSIDDVSIVEGNSGTSTLTFTVTLDAGLESGFTVDYATADDSATVADSDYTAASGTLTFAGTAGETQTISVEITGDTTAEDTEAFFVNLSGVAGNTQPVTVTDAQGIGTITTDDTTSVSLSVNVTSGTEAGETVVTLTATADQAVTGDQTVDVVVSGTGITSDDYTLSAASITIVDGETTGTVTLTIANDNSVEGDETATISISNPSFGLSLGSTTSQDVSITDNTQVQLDAIAQYPGSQPTLTWQPLAGAVRYEIWFSRISPSQSRIYSDTNITSDSYQIPAELDSAVYRYWVRGFDASDNALAWSTDNTFEVQPTLLTPLTPTFAARPTFTWEAVPFATSYEIFLRTSTGDIVETDITDTSWTPSEDLPDGDIRWWIRATDHTANRGWSEVATTNTNSRTSVTGPASPTSDTTPTFTWLAVEGAGRYVLHVQNLDTDDVPIRLDQLTTNSYTPTTELATGNYRVWVKAIESESDSFAEGIWSPAFDFTISSTNSEDLATDSLLTLLPSIEVAQEHSQETAVADTEREQVAQVSSVIREAASNAEVAAQPIVGASESTDMDLSLLDTLMSHPLALDSFTDETA